MHAALFLALTIGAPEPDDARRFFTIAVVDEQSGRGVPLVELRTVNQLRFVTDSNGIVAFREPGLMDRDVFFHVRSHGYTFPKDGFGFSGKMLRTTPGGRAKLMIKRINIAERLYRVTGAGIYADSTLVGIKVPLEEPLLNGQVLGSDSVVTAIYRGKLHWFWGDTNRASYPLGNYQVPGATSPLPGTGGLDPEQGVNLTYFVDKKGFARQTMPMPGKGPTWMTTLIPLKDRDNKERLYASFVKVEGALTIYSRGLAVWDDDKEEFAKLTDVDMKAPIFPQGHALVADGRVYFAHPYPLTRVLATAEAFRDIERYESYSCLKEGSRLDDPQMDRDAEGRIRYGWKKNTPAVGADEQAKWIRAGKLKPEEVLLQLRDRDTGKSVTAHAGSVYWNDFRKRWVMIATQHFGTSLLGEVWYAEADDMGSSGNSPFHWGVKVVTHDRYSFYNPKQHPYFSKDGGKTIFFEGTYTHTFSGNPDQTPRYDYNQIMYRIDLGDLRMALPVPVRGITNATGFAALDRPGPASVPIVHENGRLRVGAPAEKGIAFHAMAEGKNPLPATVPLYEFTDGKGFRYATDARVKFEGFTRREEPLCRVWP